MKIKKLLILCSLLLINALVSAQINYQAVLRDTDNIPISDSDFEIDVTITQDGTTIYSETHSNVSSAPLGILNLAVGAGIPITGEFDEIDWSLSDYEITVSVNGEVLPPSLIRSVPVAEYAKNMKWNWSSETSTLTYDLGSVGIGTHSAQTLFHVQNGISSGIAHAFADVLVEDSANTMVLLLSPNTRTGFLGFGDEDDSYVGGMQYDHNINEMRIRVNNHDSDILINQTGDVGIGTLNPSHKVHLAKQNGYAQLKLERTGNDAGHSLLGGSNSGFYVGHTNTSDTYVVDFKVSHSGKAEVKCLEILGGCDIKEDFNSEESLQPGDVVIIDENNPGQLKKCDSRYDRKVAGIISGANGINPGLSLSQDGVLVGEYPLAMLGQVYVKATGNVKVGDLLTTSELSGHAMAVTDYSKSPGAVIGKAMTALNGGEGFVLVLVNLQ